MIEKTHKGQVALVMVLIMTVVSAVVVSVAGRATTETRLQRLSQESAAAFLTAQSGLEDALSAQSGVSNTIDADKSYTVVLENKGQEGLLTERVAAGTSMDIVLNASALLQGIRIYWRSVSSSPSAVFVSKLSDTAIVDVGYDTLGANGFTRVSTGGTLSNVEFPYVTPQIDLDASIERVRITVFGESAFLGIEPIGDLLPIQTIQYRSEASVGSGNEKVKYGLLYEESKDKRTPEVFDYALFSFGSIIQ